MSGGPGKTIQAVDTAIALLDTIATVEDPTANDLIETAELSRSSIHHYLTSLEQAGFVTREDGVIALGDAFLELAGTRRRNLPWFPSARYHTDELAQELQCTVSIEIRNHDEMLTIYSTHGGENIEQPHLGFAQPVGESVAGAAYMIANGEDLDEYLASLVAVEDQLVISENALRRSSQDIGDDELVQITKSLCPSGDPLAVISIWIPGNTWRGSEEGIKQALSNSVGIIEVNATYAGWPGDHQDD
jgi:DNA-binding IclR family transcriptional regulator